MDELWRYKRGSVSRRHFLGVTGLGAATAVMASAMPMLAGAGKAHAGSIGDRIVASPPGRTTTIRPTSRVHRGHRRQRSDQRVRLERGDAGQVAGRRHRLGRVRSDQLHHLDLCRARPDPASWICRACRTSTRRRTSSKRSPRPGTVNGKVYAVPKNWGTTGFRAEPQQGHQQPDHLEGVLGLSKTSASGRVIVHDYQLTTIGNALKYFGYSFNSVDPNELADAEKLLLEVQTAPVRHHQRLSAGYAQRRCLDVDRLDRRRPATAPRHARDRLRARQGKAARCGATSTAIPKDAPHLDAAYAFINF